MVRENVRETRAGYGRGDIAVVWGAVVSGAAAVGCTRRSTDAAAAPVVEVVAGRSSCNTPGAVVAAAAVERAVHSYSTTAAVEIATASAAAPAVTRSRGLRNFVVAVVSVAAVVAVVVVVGVRDITHGGYMLGWPYECAHSGRWLGAVKVRARRGCARTT